MYGRSVLVWWCASAQNSQFIMVFGALLTTVSLETLSFFAALLLIRAGRLE